MKVGALFYSTLLLVASSLFANEEPATPVGSFRFSEGLATVVVDGKWGYVNTEGELAIPAIYNYGSGFRSGYALVGNGDETFNIDHAGTRIAGAPVVPSFPPYESTPLRQFFEINEDGDAKWGFKDQQGRVVIKPQYDATNAFNEGLGMFAIADDTIPGTHMRHGYIDMRGELVIPPLFDKVYPFSEGFAAVWIGDTQGYIDRKGNYLWAPAK